jgi:hypothetical protein
MKDWLYAPPAILLALIIGYFAAVFYLLSRPWLWALGAGYLIGRVWG